MPARPPSGCPYSSEAIDRICELRLVKRLALDAVGKQLDDEGMATPRGGRWWPATVRHALLLAERAGDPRARPALEAEPSRKSVRYQGTRAVAPDLAARIEALSAVERMPQHEIAEVLADEGVPTARGGKWHQSTVQSVLSGPRRRGGQPR